MADNNLDVLLRITDNTTKSLEQSKKSTTQKENKCNLQGINDEGTKYDLQKTVENINAYIASPNKLDRILYSEISNYVF